MWSLNQNRARRDLQYVYVVYEDIAGFPGGNHVIDYVIAWLLFQYHNMGNSKPFKNQTCATE